MMLGERSGLLVGRNPTDRKVVHALNCVRLIRNRGLFRLFCEMTFRTYLFCLDPRLRGDDEYQCGADDYVWG